MPVSTSENTISCFFFSIKFLTVAPILEVEPNEAFAVPLFFFIFAFLMIEKKFPLTQMESSPSHTKTVRV